MLLQFGSMGQITHTQKIGRSQEFTNTKTQVLRRLYGVLENQTFERMFTNPQSKFDMFTELNAGKLILINTSKSLLKEQGTEILGRFFIALIAQAAQETCSCCGYLPTGHGKRGSWNFWNPVRGVCANRY